RNSLKGPGRNSVSAFVFDMRRTCPFKPSAYSPRSPRMRSACWRISRARSEEHTSELQSRENLVCRLLLEKKKKKKKQTKQKKQTQEAHMQHTKLTNK